MAVNYTSSGPIGSVAFLTYPQSEQSNLAIDTNHVVVLPNEVFDQGSNFASNIFTAPIAGQYYLSFFTWVQYMDSGATYWHLKIITSNRTYNHICALTQYTGDFTYWTTSISSLADMDASDTAYCNLYQAGGSAQADVNQSGTYFSGCLVA